jgi:hypothetical protein
MPGISCQQIGWLRSRAGNGQALAGCLLAMPLLVKSAVSSPD